MLPVNNLIFDSTISNCGEWRNVSNLTALSIMLTGVESNTWVEVSNDPAVNTVLFYTNFPDERSWPLPTNQWDNVTDNGVWAAPGDVHFPGIIASDNFFVFKQPVSNAGGSLSVRYNTADAGVYLYFRGYRFGYILSLDPAIPGLTIANGVTFYTDPAVVLSAGSTLTFTMKLLGTSVLLTALIDGVEVARFVDSSPTLPLPTFASWEAFPQPNAGPDPVAIDVGSVEVTSYAPTGGINASGDLSAPSTMSEIAVIVDTVAKTALWSPSCLVWNWIRVCKNQGSPALETKAYLFGQNG